MDINPGPDESFISAMTAFNGSVYFAASSGSEGNELWKSDGTPAGTQLVKDIWPEYGMSSNPSKLTVSNGKLFFSASTDQDGPNLWKTDGTAAGTVLVSNVAFPSNLTDVNGALYFTAVGGLWKSNGTPQGTVLVKDINASSLTNVNGTLFFVGDDLVHQQALWKSDGTNAGTVQVKNIAPGKLTNVNGIVYFPADDGTHGAELWRSDGTDAGTQMVKDINLGINGSNVHSITRVNNSIFFAANDGVNGFELWKSDGTAAGTQLVKDIQTGASGSQPAQLIAYNNLVCFVAHDSSGDRAWRSDGTAAGTFKLETTSSFGGAHDLTASAGYVYFGADAELWQSDGTQAGTKVLYGADNYAGSSSPVPQQVVGSTLYFSADDGEHGVEPWISDGTVIGTRMLKDIWIGEGSSDSAGFTEVNGTIYFSGADEQNGNQLWKTDGTEEGTFLVKVIEPTGIGSYPQQLKNVNGILLFTIADVTSGLWRSDGTDAGTFLIHSIRFDGAATFVNGFNYVFNGELCFKADDGVHGSELWKSDGTTNGTILVKDINPGPDGSIPANGFGFLAAPFGSSLYFSATDGVTGFELWKTDGTAQGTTPVSDIYPGPSSSDLELFGASTALFLKADDGTNGSELWKSNGTQTGTSLLADIFPGSGPSSPDHFIEAGGIEYFSAFDPLNGQELWRTNGTPVGTKILEDLNPGAVGSMPQGNYQQDLVSANGSVFFAATDGTHGAQPWRSQGTPQTTILEEVDPNEVSSVPRDFIASNSLVYFSAYDEAHGAELWAMPVSTAPDFFFGCDSPPPITKGGSVQVSCEVRTLNSHNGNVDLTCSDLPSGVSCVFTNPKGASAEPGTEKMNLTLNTNNSVSPGRSPFKINGTDGKISRSTNSIVEIDFFYDNFEDGYASDWNAAKGSWNVTNGDLSSTTSTNSTIYSPAPFAGCSLCSIETDLRAETPGAVIALIGWHLNSKNYVELDLVEKSNKLVLKQKWNKSHAKTSHRFPINPDQDYNVIINYDGTNFYVFVNRTFLFATPALGIPNGKVGLRLKSKGGRLATASFKQLRVAPSP